MVRINLIAAMLVSGVAIAPAVAGESPSEASFLQTVDTNRDGIVSRQEITKLWVEQFQWHDLDKDRLISPLELQGTRKGPVHKRVQRRFDRLDIDRNGSIDFDEFQTSKMRWLDVVDRNGDGIITAAELSAASN